MFVTAQQVFDIALAKMDEVTDTGAIQSSDPAYITKALNILTTLQAELLPPTVESSPITDLDNVLILNTNLALSALPYGLAAELLLLDNNMTVASFFNARYDELKHKAPRDIEPIVDKYNVLNGMM